MDGRTIIKWILVGVTVAVILGYSVFALYGYFRGPRILFLKPESGFSTSTPVVTVEGKAIHIATITINDAETPTDLGGNFQSRLLIAPGYNIIRVAGKDHYNRTVEKTIEITLLPQVVATSTLQMGTTTINNNILINQQEKR